MTRYKFYENYLSELATERMKKTYWPYQITLDGFDNVKDAERFCYTHFKSKNWRNYVRFFAFKRKEDYEWFLLRWS